MALVLDIQDLTIDSPDQKRIVDRVCLQIQEKAIVGLVGGSGSGKTTTALSVLRLLEGFKISSGKILLSGQDILKLPDKDLPRIRGRHIGMVFQEPLQAFNPVFTLGYQIEEVLRFHLSLNKSQRRQRLLDLLSTVGIDDPRRIAGEYPHRLSGGLRQRAMIAQAIAAQPKLLMADEPTSNLDVTLQARIIELFQELNAKLGISILLITHDLGVVRHLTQHVSVMRQGAIVESGRTQDVLGSPRHDYTKQLLKTMEQ